ncbi:MAG: hypothetical protein FJ263_04310 [Planctomycetes bacterium]|nr:hypothetical protein [Planctomycetota bacterium]
MFNPFETPWLLLIIGIVILASGSWIRNNLSPRKGLWLILAGIVIMAGALSLDYAVKTDYEQIRGLIDTCRKAAVAGEARPIEPCISEHYQDSGHSSKSAFLNDAKRILKTAGISRIRFRSLTFQISPPTAKAALAMTIFLDPQKSAIAAGGLFFVEMSVHFQKENNRWTIISAEIESVNNERTNWNIAH